MPNILVVDDDRTVLHLVTKSLTAGDVRVITARTAAEGVAAVTQQRPDVVLLDILLPGVSGLDVFEQIRQLDRRLPVIFITADVGSGTAIDAMQRGAYDYVAKPLDLPRLKELIAQALETRRLMSVPVALPIVDEPATDGDAFIGRSREMLDVFKVIGRVAAQNVTVLIRGESGSGKELVARALYQHGDRRDQPFLAVNCAALPDTLLESDLFGHEKGAFTGADRRRIGKFEQCDGGTLFLDEVGDMSPLVQSKVLRLLQEQKFERVGGMETITTDVRLIAATNQDLDAMVGDGRFRADLLYRLNGVSIFLPPLRQRGEDIPLLLQHFVTCASHELGKPETEGISPEALDLLMQYPWPGNVRELQSVVRQALLNASGPVIVPEFLPPEVRGATAGADAEAPVATGTDLTEFIDERLRAGSTKLYAETLALMERCLLTRVLQQTEGNQSRAAEILGITRGKIRSRIAEYGISVDKSVSIEGP